VVAVTTVVLALLSPLIAQLIRLAVSRRREFLADASGALVTRNPDALATALLKIAGDKEPLEVANKGTAHLYFENPFKDKQRGGVGWFAGLFNTHPPVEERVAALRSMQ
jgi:heat shock protein HtpX